MSPLARVPSLKLKLGLVIVVAIAVTLVTMVVAARLGLRMRWGVAVAIPVSLLCVQVVARGMTAPLRQLARAAEATARGEHGQRVPVASRDEVGQLAASFNRMAGDLERTEALRQAFVADAAHELRTPISALRASLENAVDGIEPADPQALLAQVDRLGRLADQLLDLSRLQAGASALHARRFPIADVLDDCGAPVEAPADLHAVGDPDRLRQVVANLVDNARRHAPGAAVVVRAQPRPTGVRLEVEDAGPGLDPDDVERVFERFARADRSRSAGGAGLGLAIARSIVELHGGTIRAEPVVPHGCRMVVDLP